MPARPFPARHRALAALVGILGAASVAAVPGTPAAQAAPAPTTTPWVVSVGDSYISGEGGRWAGNESFAHGAIDTGSDAYFDDPAGTGETIPYCHRSKSAMIHLGPEVNSLNLACSGATTKSAFDRTDKDRTYDIPGVDHWKPGIDFADRGAGYVGQAKLLADFAKDHPVKMVALSIGGNDFNFSDIVEACVKSYLTPGWFTDDCSQQPKTLGYVNDKRAAQVRSDIAAAIGNIRTAMQGAGIADADWTLVVNTYPQVLPYPADMRYRDGTYVRWSRGGCGFRNADLTWALNDALGTINRTVKGAVSDAQAASPANKVVTMENSAAFAQRALCDRHVDRLSADPFSGTWRDAGAVDRSEWVMEINAANPGAQFKQESLHPNYWGQLALRNCLRQVWNGGAVRGGTCVRTTTGLNSRNEPNVELRGALDAPVPAAVGDRFTVAANATTVSPSTVLAGDVDHPVYIGSLPSTPARQVAAVAAATPASDDLVLPAVAGGLSAELVVGPANGTIVLTADGTVVYTPAPGFTGTDSFTYVASDFYGSSEPATVTLQVTADGAGNPSPARPVPASPAFTG